MSAILNKIKSGHTIENTEIIERAFEFAEKAHEGQLRRSGEPFFIHPCYVAEILFEWGLDTATIAAGFLHDVVEDTDVEIETVEEKFGKEIAMLVNGVTKIRKLEISSRELRQAENFRKMLLAMAEDIRVIIIKLADRLHNMRTLKYRGVKSQMKVAQETLEIYAPLAHRLGIFKVKWELEDLAFYYMHPEDYKDLAKKVAMRRQEREDIIKNKIETIRKAMKDHNIDGTIEGRPKHFYSIYNKMKSKNKPFDQIYDLTAIRIVVDDIKACYAALGLVHTIWKPIPGRFKDYIAMPKPNLYQSIHSTLMGEHGAPFEVQIRTKEMHRTAEYGIAAHWKYKGKAGVSNDKDFNSKLEWLRHILEWQNETNDAMEFMDSIKLDLFSDEVFVFTPKGDVINLAVGATTIDFAYRIHSAVGNRCIGAKVNGRIVPIHTQLKTGDIISIITSKTGKPSRDWLNIAKTSHARNKIRTYFKKAGREDNIEKGKHMLEEAIKRHNISLNEVLKKEWIDKYCQKHTLKSMDDVYATVGYGGLATGQVITFFVNKYKAENKDQEQDEIQVIKVKKPSTTSNGVIVKGQKNMLVRFAQCCHPVQGDQITGYITRGRGVSIHRSDCYNVKNLPDDDPRFIEVSWEGSNTGKYNARLSITIADTPGMIVQISNAIQSLGIDLVRFNATVTTEQVAKVELTVRISNTDQLDNLIKKIKTIEGCIQIYRRTS